MDLVDLFMDRTWDTSKVLKSKSYEVCAQDRLEADGETKGWTKRSKWEAGQKRARS